MSKKEMETQFNYKYQSSSHDDFNAKILKLQQYLSSFLGVILHLWIPTVNVIQSEWLLRIYYIYFNSI